MPIVSSSYQVGHQQIDGRRYITETHQDSGGTTHVTEYLSPSVWSEVEYTTHMNEYAVSLVEALAQAEADALLLD